MSSNDSSSCNHAQNASNEIYWVEKFSNSKPGKSYYFNVKTGESSWIRPKGVTVQDMDDPASRVAKAPKKRKSSDIVIQSLKRSATCILPNNTRSVDSKPACSSDFKPTQHGNVSAAPQDIIRNSKILETRGVENSATLHNCDRSIVCHSQNLPSQQPVNFSKNSSHVDGPTCLVVSREVQPSQLHGTEARKKKRAKRKKKSNMPVALATIQTTDVSRPAGCFTRSSIISAVKCHRSTACLDSSTTLDNVSSVSNKEDCNHISKNQISNLKHVDDPRIKTLSNVNYEKKQPAQARLGKLLSLRKCMHPAQDQAAISKTACEPSKIPQKSASNVSGQMFVQEQILTEPLKKLQGCDEQKPLSILKNEEAHGALSSLVNISRAEATMKSGSAEMRLKNLQSKLRQKEEIFSNVQQSPAPECAALANYSSGRNMPHEENDMEVEFMESEVLLDIGKLRQNDVAMVLSEQPIFMDIDVHLPMSDFDYQSAVYIVLDTNICLAHLKFVEGLRDTVIPGKGPVHLFLPWQVLHELDHLKDKGKPSVQFLARRAIKYLHENFSSKHPRVHGEKMSQVPRNSYDCPDDYILQSCLQLKKRDSNVVLLSNDTNLLNKALVSDLTAFSKDQLLEQLSENSKCLSMKNTTASPMQGDPSQDASFHKNDAILCEFKNIIKEVLGQVVSQGMEREYKLLWKRRTIHPPPWEADQVMTCLCHHWFSVCGDFVPDFVKNATGQLKKFFNVKAKRFGVGESDLKESLQLTKDLLKFLPDKYKETVSTVSKRIEDLVMRMDGTAPPPVQESGSSVLLCFEEAHNAAKNLCLSSASSDPDWKQNVQNMIGAVHSLIRLLRLLLVKPLEFLNEDDPSVNELVSLIKGGHNITSMDIINFCRLDSNRLLLENGIQQFVSFEAQLVNKLQSSI